MTKFVAPISILTSLSILAACASQQAGRGAPTESWSNPAPSPTPIVSPWPSTHVPCEPKLEAKQIQEAFAKDPLFGSQKIKILYVGSGTAGTDDPSVRQTTDFLYESGGSKYTGHIEFDWDSCSAGNLRGGFEMLKVH